MDVKSPAFKQAIVFTVMALLAGTCGILALELYNKEQTQDAATCIKHGAKPAGYIGIHLICTRSEGQGKTYKRIYFDPQYK